MNAYVKTSYESQLRCYSLGSNKRQVFKKSVFIKNGVGQCIIWVLGNTDQPKFVPVVGSTPTIRYSTLLLTVNHGVGRLMDHTAIKLGSDLLPFYISSASALTHVFIILGVQVHSLTLSVTVARPYH